MSLSLRRYLCPCISGDVCVPTVPVSPEISMSLYLWRFLCPCYVAAAAAVPVPGSPDALWAGPPSGASAQASDSCTVLLGKWPCVPGAARDAVSWAVVAGAEGAAGQCIAASAFVWRRVAQGSPHGRAAQVWGRVPGWAAEGWPARRRALPPAGVSKRGPRVAAPAGGSRSRWGPKYDFRVAACRSALFSRAPLCMNQSEMLISHGGPSAATAGHTETGMARAHGRVSLEVDLNRVGTQRRPVAFTDGT